MPCFDMQHSICERIPQEYFHALFFLNSIFVVDLGKQPVLVIIEFVAGESAFPRWNSVLLRVK